MNNSSRTMPMGTDITLIVIVYTDESVLVLR